MRKGCFHLFLDFFNLILSDAAKPASMANWCLPCPVRCANIHKIFNRSGIWANRNLSSFSVGSVRTRSAFSVESAEFGSVANNDVTV